jgi:hypothetical protein
MEKIMYGIRNKKTGKLLGFETTSNEGAEFCNSVEYSLEEDSDRPWLVRAPYHARYVLENSAEWYNAGYATPSHTIKKIEDYEVVRVKTEVEPVEQKIFTPKEIMYLIYGEFGTREFGHIEMVLSQSGPYKNEHLKFNLYQHIEAQAKYNELCAMLVKWNGPRTGNYIFCEGQNRYTVYLRKVRQPIEAESEVLVVYEACRRIKELLKDEKNIDHGTRVVGRTSKRKRAKS